MLFCRIFDGSHALQPGFRLLLLEESRELALSTTTAKLQHAMHLTAAFDRLTLVASSKLLMVSAADMAGYGGAQSWRWSSFSMQKGIKILYLRFWYNIR